MGKVGGVETNEKQLGDVFIPEWEGFPDYLENISHRRDAVETHLEQNGGKPFIRTQERPELDARILRQVSEPFQLLSEQFGRADQGSMENVRAGPQLR